MLPNIFRAVVSAPKQTCYESETCLDLSYITPRIIVAAGPSDNILTNIFRSPMSRVVEHLNRSHKTGEKNNWHIWNLRGEGPGYRDSTNLQGNWTYHPFPDHQPPTIDLIKKIVSEIDSFLQASPNNVAFIHCKEGKGRSGTICCAFLLWEAKQRGVLLTVDEVIVSFTKRRMRRCFGNGVSIICQIRYLEYWKRYLQLSPEMKLNFKLYNRVIARPFNEKLSAITKITVVKPNPLLILSKLKVGTYVDTPNGLEIKELYEENLRIPSMSGSHAYYEFVPRLSIAKHKDLKIEFYRKGCLAYAWINMYFETLGPANRPLPIASGEIIVPCRCILPWKEFDGYRGTKYRGMAQLFDKVEVQWVYHFKGK